MVSCSHIMAGCLLPTDESTVCRDTFLPSRQFLVEACHLHSLGVREGWLSPAPPGGKISVDRSTDGCGVRLWALTERQVRKRQASRPSASASPASPAAAAALSPLKKPRFYELTGPAPAFTRVAPAHALAIDLTARIPVVAEAPPLAHPCPVAPPRSPLVPRRSRSSQGLARTVSEVHTPSTPETCPDTCLPLLSTLARTPELDDRM